MIKKLFALFIICTVLLSSSLPVFALDGKVTYTGNSGGFIFEPSSDQQLSDLFPNFKSVMPGDSLTQKITVKNKASNRFKVKIYIRSLGAQPESADFLSKLNLKVKKSNDNTMGYMFDAPANETAGLTDWVYLGTLYSGGEVNLDVTLNVPTELPNEYQMKLGILNWEFKVEEFPIEFDDPKAPQTGDNSKVELWFILLISSFILLFILFIIRKKDNEKEDAKQ